MPEVQHMSGSKRGISAEPNNLQIRLSALEDKAVAREHVVDSDLRSLKEAIVSITESLLGQSSKRSLLKSSLEYPKRVPDHNHDDVVLRSIGDETLFIKMKTVDEDILSIKNHF